MHNSVLVKTFIVLALFSASAHTADSAEPNAAAVSPQGVLRGTVVDMDGRLQSNVVVRLHFYDADRREFQTPESEQETSATGGFEFRGLADGYPGVAAYATGMAMGFKSEGIQNGSTAEVEVVVSPAVKCTLQVLDPDGNPLNGASVRELRTTDGNGDNLFLSRSIQGVFARPLNSEGDGRISLPEFQCNSKIIAVIGHPDFASVRMTIELRAAEDLHTVSMTRGVPLQLEITDKGAPAAVEQVEIQFFASDDQNASELRYAELPVNEGRASITVAAGSYRTLWLRHPDFWVTPLLDVSVNEDSPFRLQAPHGARFEFTLHPKQTARGRVVNELTGEAIAGVTVKGDIFNYGAESVPGMASEWCHTAWATTDTNGEYGIPLAPGKVRVGASMSGMFAAPLTAELADADGSDLPLIRMKQIPPVRGIVLADDNTPVSGAVVRLHGTLRLTPPVVTGADGRFQIDVPYMPPTDFGTDEIAPKQPIVAFDPHAARHCIMDIVIGESAEVSLMLASAPADEMLNRLRPQLSAWEQSKLTEEMQVFVQRSRVGEQAPELDGIEWLNTNGRQMKLADFRGKYVLLDFWTTWCGPCHADLPSVQLVHDLFGDHDVVVIGVHDNSTSREQIRTHVTHEKMTFPIVVDHPDGRITAAWKEFGLRGYPSYMLVDPEGKLIHTDRNSPGPTLRTSKLEIVRSLILKD